MLAGTANFLRHSRAMFLTATLVPVLLGGALAYADTHAMRWSLFLLTLAGTFAAHLGTNLSNDYYDFQLGADRPGRPRMKFSGGGDSLTRDGIGPGRVKAWFVLSFLVGVLIFAVGLAMIDRGRIWIVALTATGMLAGFFYTAPPLKLAYRGLGELSVLIFVGPTPVLVAYIVQTGEFSTYALLASLPVAFWIAALIAMNEYTDFEGDRAAGKNNLVVRLGKRRARWLVLMMLVLAYVCLTAPMALRPSGWPSLLPFLTLPLIARAVSVFWRHFDDDAEVVTAQGLVLATHVCGGLLISAGVMLKHFL